MWPPRAALVPSSSGSLIAPVAANGHSGNNCRKHPVCLRVLGPNVVGSRLRSLALTLFLIWCLVCLVYIQISGIHLASS